MHAENLLVIMSDEHNPKFLGVAGHPFIATPNLDALSRRGTRFTAAYTACPICVPARAAFAVGRYLHDIGYWDNADAYDGAIPSWHHRLRAAGHRVVAIGCRGSASSRPLSKASAGLRAILDPAAVDARAKRRQAALLANFGGRAAALARGDLDSRPRRGPKRRSTDRGFRGRHGFGVRGDPALRECLPGEHHEHHDERREVQRRAVHRRLIGDVALALVNANTKNRNSKPPITIIVSGASVRASSCRQASTATTIAPYQSRCQLPSRK